MNAIGKTPRTVEQRLNEWLSQPGTVVSGPEREFISYMRKSAAQGVGYGWMQQVIEWEWKSKGSGSWGPEYFQAQLRDAQKARDAAVADAERYRWLRSPDSNVADVCYCSMDTETGLGFMDGETLDSAIDAAIRALKDKP